MMMMIHTLKIDKRERKSWMLITVWCDSRKSLVRWARLGMKVRSSQVGQSWEKMVVPGGVGGMVKVQASALSAWLSALPPAFLIRRHCNCTWCASWCTGRVLDSPLPHRGIDAEGEGKKVVSGTERNLKLSWSSEPKLLVCKLPITLLDV